MIVMEMSYEQITQILINELRNQFNVDLNEESDVMDHLDSLDIMAYLIFVEEKFNIKIEDDQVDKGGILIVGKTAEFILEQSKKN